MNTPRILAGSSLCTLALMAAPLVHAVDYNNGGGNQYWGNGANWIGGSAPDAAGATARIVTSSTSANQILLLADSSGNDASFTVGAFLFGSGGGSANQNYRLNNVAGGTSRLVFEASSGNASLTFNNIFANVSMSFNVGATLNSNLTVTASRSGSTHTINGSIESGVAGTGVTYNVVSGGLLTLTAANTYTGMSDVTSGRVALSSTGSLASASLLRIASGATFDVVSKSSYAIGTGGVTLAVGASTAGYFNAGAAALTFGNALSLEMSGSTFAESYNLFDFGSQSGDFSSVSLTGSITGSLVLTSADTWTGTFGGHAFSFSEASGVLSMSAIPEPSSFALAGGFAALGLIAGTRRRRR